MDTWVIYVRNSRFSKKGESIENQIRMCKEYIYSRFSGVKEENIYTFQDEGFSGKNTDRPQFQKMMEGINKNKFGYVICYKLDRISRSIIDFSSLIQGLEVKGVKFISIKEQFDTTTPMGRAMMFISAVFAQMEREAIAERVRDNLMLLARTGRWLGGKLPVGFDSKKSSEYIIDGKVKTATFLVENDEIRVIKLIFEKFLEMGSPYLVAKYLANKKIMTVNQNLYSKETVNFILRNPVYCTADKDSFEYFKEKGSDICFSEKDFKKKLGIIPFNRKATICWTRTDESKWIIALGKHKGIISGRDWVIVQKIIYKRKIIPHTYHIDALISGLITCENCGSPMLVRTNYKGINSSTFSYVCREKYKLGLKKCNMKNLLGKKTEKKIIDYIMSFDIENLKKSINIAKYSRKVNKFEDKFEDIKFEILELEELKEKLFVFLEKNDNSSFFENIKNRINKINDKIEKLNKKKQTYDFEFHAAKEEKFNVEQIIKNLEYFKKNFYDLDFEHKKSLLRLVLNKLTWNGAELKIFLNGEQN